MTMHEAVELAVITIIAASNLATYLAVRGLYRRMNVKD